MIEVSNISCTFIIIDYPLFFNIDVSFNKHMHVSWNVFLKLDNSNKLIIHFSSCFLVLPGAFQSAVHGVITHAEYATGVRHTIRAGGCNCSRAGFIGACLGAQVGHDTTCLRAIRNHNSQHRKLRNTKKNNCDFSSIIFSIFFFHFTHLMRNISWNKISLETEIFQKINFFDDL